METGFENTIDVLNKILKNEVERKQAINSTLIKDKVTQKQFQWLMSVYIKDTNKLNLDLNIIQSITDKENNQYSFGYKYCQSKVPYYIPNSKKYGKVYFITKCVKNEQ